MEERHQPGRGSRRYKVVEPWWRRDCECRTEQQTRKKVNADYATCATPAGEDTGVHGGEEGEGTGCHRPAVAAWPPSCTGGRAPSAERRPVPGRRRAGDSPNSAVPRPPRVGDGNLLCRCAPYDANRDRTITGGDRCMAAKTRLRRDGGPRMLTRDEVGSPNSREEMRCHLPTPARVAAAGADSTGRTPPLPTAL